MLDGVWNVKVHGLWLITAVNLFGDEKVISGSRGFNRMVGKEFGYFFIDDRRPSHFILDYNDIRNPEWMRKIVDRMIQVEDDKCLGTLYLAGKRKFDFTITRRRNND